MGAVATGVAAAACAGLGFAGLEIALTEVETLETAENEANRRERKAISGEDGDIWFVLGGCTNALAFSPLGWAAGKIGGGGSHKEAEGGKELEG